jgi:D-alanine-D-alanine ligase
MKVSILYDRLPENEANPDQTDVLSQADAVCNALSELGHHSNKMTFDLDLNRVISELKKTNPDFVFNLVESVEGHGKLIYLAPSVLDLLKISYSGSDADALYMTSNKVIAKQILSGANIDTPEYYSISQAKDKGLPVNGHFIIKSLWEHASMGLGKDSVVFVDNTPDLFAEMNKLENRLGGSCFAERYIEGREFNISLIASEKGPEVLPHAEICFEDYFADKKKIVDYNAKWNESSPEYCHTRRSFDFESKDSALLDRLSKISKKCWDLFGIRGYLRVDYRVDESNRPWVLELNANPCISPDSGFIAAASRAGISYKEAVNRIIRDSGVYL